MKMLQELNTDFLAVAERRDVMATAHPHWATLREEAKAHFSRHGLPSKKQEDWKYTSLWGFGQESFVHELEQITHVDSTPYEIVKSAIRLVIIDGRVDLTASEIADLPAGVTVMPFSQAIDQVEPYLNQQISVQQAGLNALNTMLMNEGVFIEIAPHTQVDKIIELLVLHSREEAPHAMHLRNVIVLGENSRATFIETYASADAAPGFTNVVTEVSLAPHATLHHLKFQKESSEHYHVATVAAKQAEHSQWFNTNISLGSKLTRNDIHSQLLGEQAHASLNGLYLADGSQHVDNHTRIDHAVPNTTSQELYKGVLDNEAHGVFNGKVVVHKDAQKTDANQSNRNLLLSRTCEIDTKPEMEIYADDVKCGHGSTVGQLDEEQLFFLRSRGLDEQSARNLLIFAFAIEVLDGIESAEIKEAVIKRIEKRLPRGGEKS